MTKPLATRFWAKVRKGGSNDCWLWQAGTTGRGYGYIRRGGKTRHELAHRIAYELERGPIPTGMHVLHSCDNPPCVNPAHLFTGTNADNMHDRDAKGRGTKPPVHKRAAHPRAKLTEAQVSEIRQSTDPLKVICERFGIGMSQASTIRRGKGWK